MNTVILGPEQDLIEVLLPYIKGDERDYSPSLVVFPGKRPSHFLRKALAARIGTSFIPPCIFSMDEFVDNTYETVRPGKKLETLDAIAILYNIHRKSPRPLGGSGFMTPESFFPLGLKIYRDIEELTIEGIVPKMVKGIESYIAEGMPQQTGERLLSLSHFHEEFYKEITVLGVSTRSRRYQTAAEEIERAGLRKFERIVLAGFFALTSAEKAIFRKLLAYDNAIFIFQDGPGMKNTLEDLGIAYQQRNGKVKEAEIHFYSSPDTHGQVLALGQILRAKVEAGEPLDEKTVIVLPSSDTLFPLMRQGLSAVPDDAYNVSLGYPLHRTPVFGFLNVLMELVASMEGDRIYVPDYLKFVLHPYTKNIYYHGRSETTRILFHAIEEELLRHRTKTFSTLSEIAGNETLYEDVMKRLPTDEKGVTAECLREHLTAIHKNTLEKFLSFENIGDFAGKCIDVLVYVYNNSTARLHPLFHPFSESFIASLDVLTRSMMKDIAFAEITSYFVFFRKFIMTGHTPFSGTPVKGLQVLGSLETRNLKFDRVFVLDANEEILPDTRREETLLPFKAREILGMPTYMDRDKLAAYYFYLLLGGAREVHLFFRENDKAERSRFVQRLLWERQKQEKSTDARSCVSPVQYRVSLVNSDPGAISKTVEMVDFLKTFRYSATSLNLYLKCPLHFYYAAVLRLNRQDTMSGDIERDALGTFVHRVLRRYFADKKERPLKESDLSIKQMESLIETLFSREYGRNPAGALFLLKRQIKRHLTDVLMHYYIPLVRTKKLAVLDCEEEIHVRVDSFALQGRLDSVEQRDDAVMIVDYKTGSSSNFLKIDVKQVDPNRRETWGEAIGSLQLPFYVLLYAEKKSKPIDALNALFLLLGRTRISADIELPLFDGSTPAEVFAPLRKVIFKLLKEITDPSVPFSPATDRKRTCPGCDYQYVCGTQWIVK